MYLMIKLFLRLNFFLVNPITGGHSSPNELNLVEPVWIESVDFKIFKWNGRL